MYVEGHLFKLHLKHLHSLEWNNEISLEWIKNVPFIQNESLRLACTFYPDSFLDCFAYDWFSLSDRGWKGKYLKDGHKKTAEHSTKRIESTGTVSFHFDFPLLDGKPSLSPERLCLSVFSRGSPQCLRLRNDGETSRNIVTALAKLLKTFINQTVCCNGC